MWFSFSFITIKYYIIWILLRSENRETYAAVMIAQRNSLGGKLPNYNIKKRQSSKSAKQREKIHFSHSSQIGWCTQEFYIWALAPESMASGCGHFQICSLVKWSVRLNDLSDFGLLTDEIDWEGGAAVAPSIRLMMAQASDGILRRRSRLKRSFTNIGAPNPDPVIMGWNLTPDFQSWHRDIDQFYEWCGALLF